MSSPSLRPPLKWAGGKRWLVPHLVPLWRPHADRRMVEPLCGGLAVSLSLRPERALLNDVNPHLINFYRWLKQGLRIEVEMVNDEAQYYLLRERFNELIQSGQRETAETASLFYYLNRTGYNGLCRFNKKGAFNVPFGRYARIRYNNDFTSYCEAFSRWDLSCQAVETLPLDPQDFIYADPPYDVQFTSYSQGGFSWADQVRLAELLAKHPGPVVLSNQATPRILDLYQQLGFEIRTLPAPRRISCTGDRTPALEVLALKNISNQ